MISGVIGGIIFPGLRQSYGVIALADVGVAFLLFTLGLEFSRYRLERVKKVALYGGILQILAVTFWGIFLFSLFGMSFYEALFLGCVFSFSSTAVVFRLLSDRGELDTLPGEIMVGILAVQDLAVLPMAILLPTLASLAINPIGIFPTAIQVISAIFRASVLLFVVILIGKKGMPLALQKIERLNSRELLLLAVCGLCLTAALFTRSLGLSFALGAFLAGILIAETSLRHAVFGEVRPLRDVFSIIFFVSLGLFFDVHFFLSAWSTILLFGMAVLIVKFAVLFLITIFFGYHQKTAFCVSLGIFQVGEFAFLLSQSALGSGYILPQTYSLILATTMLTIMVTPFLFSIMPRTVAFLNKNVFSKITFFKRYLVKFPFPEELENLSSHVIICGYGRVGKHIGRALTLVSVPFIVIDYNYHVTQNLREHGQRVIYGDPTEPDVLKAARLNSALAVIIAINDRLSQEAITSIALSQNPHIIIISRSHFDEDRERLLASGVNFVIQPEFEAGIAIISLLLSLYKKSTHETNSLLNQIRRERNL